jgi:2-dehydro-3-deoxygalactonokinase
MIGSRQGWIEAPYVACPADADALAHALARTPGGELAIVAGVTCRDAAGVPDVMRGEETQLVGAIGPRDSAVAVLPGTHSKWAHVENGRIAAFATYMTGELYSVLLAHSILGRMAAQPPDQPGEAFARGVARGLGEGGLSHHLFGARTLALMGELRAQQVPDWLSGMLIGHEIRSARDWAHRAGGDAARVRVIGDDALSARYIAALGQAGIAADCSPAGAAARGLYQIARRARLID